MLKIKVNNQEIYITQGTSIQMEVSNNIFSIDEIPGEIIYTFDVPATQNDKIFNFARFTYIQKQKKYEAEILVGGVQIAKGDLYIQKATKTTYSLGLVVNPFSMGWDEKKLDESDYGEIVISTNSEEHQSKWIEFLARSLQDNADIKFPLFIDQNFYGGKNDDFGFFALPSDNGSRQASLYNNNSIGLEKFYVNRLFTESGSDVVELEDSRGIRIFNKITNSNKRALNSFCFCPAFNLFYFIKLFFRNIDKKIIGNFINNSKLSCIYFQSLRALDSAINDDIKLGVSVKANKKLTPHYYLSTGEPPYRLTLFEHEGCMIHAFRPENDGIIDFEIEIKVLLSEGFFPDTFYLFIHQLGMYLISDTTPDPEFINYQGLYGYEPIRLGYLSNNLLRSFYPEFARFFQSREFVQTYGDKFLGGIYDFKYNFSVRLSKNKVYRFHIDGFSGDFSQYHDMCKITPKKYNLFDYEKLGDIHPYNFFAKSFKINQHAPCLTNGEFLKTIKSTFGLLFYMDCQKREVELSFVKDVFQSSYIQLDNFLLNNESYISESEENEIIYILPPVTENEIDDKRLIAQVEEITELPNAISKFGKIAFVRDQNKYVESVKEGDAIENWRYVWKKHSGNNKNISVGKGESLEIKPNVLISNMKDNFGSYRNTLGIQINPGFEDVILEIDKTGVSPLYTTEDTDFELILINCIGLKNLSKTISGKQLKYESAVLVDSDTTNKYDLCVSGENSIGKIFIEPWLNLLANHEIITHKFLLDLKTFLEVWRLLKPQDMPPEQQTRWVMVGSVKLLPIKMTFQFTEGKPYILAEIEFAKPLVEI